MKWGTDNEIDALATLLTKILPMYFPDVSYYEEGCCQLHHKGKTLLWWVLMEAVGWIWITQLNWRYCTLYTQCSHRKCAINVVINGQTRIPLSLIYINEQRSINCLDYQHWCYFTQSNTAAELSHHRAMLKVYRIFVIYWVYWCNEHFYTTIVQLFFMQNVVSEHGNFWLISL